MAKPTIRFKGYILKMVTDNEIIPDEFRELYLSAMPYYNLDY